MSSDQWPLVRLGDVVEVKHGFAFKTKYASADPSPYALFTRKNVAVGGGFREDGPRYYHGDFADRFLLDPGDLMVVLTDLSKSGDLLGLPAIVPVTEGVRYLHNQRVGKVVIRDRGISPEYLYGLLRSPDYRRHVLDTASQTTVRDTAPSRLHDYEFKLPSPLEQMRIAWVLGALDDKIDSNRRLAEILEQAVATLFRSRFINRDPSLGPDHSDVALAELTLLVHRGRAPRYCDEGGTLVVNQKCIRDGAIDFGRARRHDSASRPIAPDRLLRIGDVLVNSTGTGTLGRLAPVRWLPEPATVDSHVTIVRPNPDAVEPFYLVHELATRQAEIEALAEGSTGQTELNRSRLAELRVPNPARSSQRVFAQVAGSAAAMIGASEREVLLLAGVRDSLLPKLISGEIRVPDATDPAEVTEPIAEAAAASS